MEEILFELFMNSQSIAKINVSPEESSIQAEPKNLQILSTFCKNVGFMVRGKNIPEVFLITDSIGNVLAEIGPNAKGMDELRLVPEYVDLVKDICQQILVCMETMELQVSQLRIDKKDYPN